MSGRLYNITNPVNRVDGVYGHILKKPKAICRDSEYHVCEYFGLRRVVKLSSILTPVFGGGFFFNA